MMDKDANVALFVAGFNAAVSGANQKLTNEEANRRYNDYNTKVAQPRVTAKWKDDNTKFLEENKKRKEVVTTASGLQYEVLKKGRRHGFSERNRQGGRTLPRHTDHRRIFDSSVQRNKTATFGLNQVIRGWTEGLQYMKEGDKFRFYIPYNLAYGEQSRGATIKGYSTLIFDVELFKVNP
jgi:FKBP-type peptidyl-prolyl cis-trans isomerase